MGISQGFAFARPAGSNTQVQFNDGGLFGADPNFTWDKTKGLLQLEGVSTVATLGADLVTNGSFTGSATGWTLAASWAYSANNVIHTAGSAGDISQAFAVEAGRMYQVIFTVGGRTAGTLTPKIGAAVGLAVSSNGVQTQYIYASAVGNLIFTASTTFDGTLDTVSVKAVSNTDPIVRLKNSDDSIVIEMRGGGDLSTAYENTLIGLNSGWRLVTGHSNIALGDHTLEYAVSASWNTAIGNSVLSRLTTGIDNTVVGVASAPVMVSGSYNSAFGESCMFSLVDGNYNCCFGEDSLYYCVSGSRNFGFGRRALLNTLTDDNVGAGYETQVLTTTGGKNSTFGNYSLASNVTGANNTAVGYEAGFSALGSGNVFLGYQAGRSEAGSNKLYIGNSTTSKLIVGDFATGRVGFNTITPGSTIHSQGPVQLWDASDNSGTQLKFLGSNTAFNFLIGNQNNLSGSLEITPSTALGGSTFTTPLVAVCGTRTNVGIGTGATLPDTKAVLELVSTTQAFLPPRMTTVQKNAIAAPTEGSVVYDLTLRKLCVYTTAWETVTSA